MRAIRAGSPGGPEVLALVEHPEPLPAADEVQICVRLAGVNFHGVGGRLRRDALESLAVFGRLVHYGNPSGEPEAFPSARWLRERNVGLRGFHFQTLRAHHRDGLAESLTTLFRRQPHGEPRIPRVDVLPLERVVGVHRLLESRQVSGKLLPAVSR